MAKKGVKNDETIKRRELILKELRENGAADASQLRFVCLKQIKCVTTPQILRDITELRDEGVVETMHFRSYMACVSSRMPGRPQKTVVVWLKKRR